MADLKQDAINWSNNTSSAITGFLENPLSGIEHPFTSSGGDPSTTPTPAKKPAAKPSTPNPSQEASTIVQDVGKVLGPEEQEAASLPEEYSSAMAQINGLPGGSAGPDAALNQATAATTAALKAGEGGVETALAKEGPAIQTLSKDLPYADVLATTLTQKKNELLYGTSVGATEFQPSEKGWSQNLKDIYSYLQGKTPGASVVPSLNLGNSGLPGSTTGVGGLGGGITGAGNLGAPGA